MTGENTIYTRQCISGEDLHVLIRKVPPFLDMDTEATSYLMPKNTDHVLKDVYIPTHTRDRIKQCITDALNPAKNIKDSNGSPGHVLLYGAPGTGKTCLTNAIASEFGETTCFTLSFYEIRNEKVLNDVFTHARQSKPAIIFLDDVEVFSIAEKADGKKIKSEFLTQLQGPGVNIEGVVVVGMTNKPWKLDLAVLSCFTSSDIVSLVRDALMEPVREIQRATHYVKVGGTASSDSHGTTDKWSPCSAETPGGVAMTYLDMEADDILLQNVSMDHLLNCLSTCKPSVDDDYVNLLAKFTKDIGTQSM
ncbi:vacuolar protein sorting-associated protein 4B-like isoform X3 [Ostrea edulis]|uniref:vacuolar protein sorting-associated protein 4B-like isoform X3 n=1 Tax=Ostrea edulis TaxID=37623 RepID=UPI0024AF1984|nr:vacuolar protein sorting-associated protein 4B-like isoform X3 [Ostrea edulis]